MNKERIASFFFLIPGIYGLIFSLEMPVGDLREPGPAMFPLALSVLLCLSGSVMLLRKPSKDKSDSKIFKQVKTAVQILGISAIYVLILGYLGYLIATPLFLLSLLFGVSRYKFWVASTFALILGVGSWFLFVKALEVSLPLGVWGI